MIKTVEINKGKNLVHPTHTPLSQGELINELKKAEEGTFISVQDGMKDFEQWLQSKENK